MAGYIRSDTANNIADGNIINASDLDGEFDTIQAAFVNTTGHTHDGTAAEGAPITKIGPTQDVVASATTLNPKTTNTVDLGTNSLKFKDIYAAGTAYVATLDLTNALAVADGGTGATTLTGVLKGNGTSAFTAGNVNLTSEVTGTLPVGNGGSGAATFTANNVLLGNGTSAFQVVAPGTAGNILTSNGTTWQSTAPAAGGVSTISFGSTGLTPSTATSGAVTVAGTLAIANGGTGATTLAGANIPVTNVANTFTGTQTFSGSSSALAAVLTDAAEVATISATAATGTINYDITTQSVLYYTSNASANWTTNFRASSGTSLNTAMSTGQSVTVAFLVTQGATAYYNNVVQVDGTTSGVTTRWIGGAPTAGNASGIDSYRYVIIKTASATFTVLASNTQFKA
jgi:hypothetical protein